MHDLKPPFLDGKTVFTKQLEPINPVKDGLSDMAVFARKGSRLVRETREKAERAKAAGKVAAMGGLRLATSSVSRRTTIRTILSHPLATTTPPRQRIPTVLTATQTLQHHHLKAKAIRSSPVTSKPIPPAARNSVEPKPSKNSVSTFPLSPAAKT